MLSLIVFIYLKPTVPLAVRNTSVPAKLKTFKTLKVLFSICNSHSVATHELQCCENIFNPLLISFRVCFTNCFSI